MVIKLDFQLEKRGIPRELEKEVLILRKIGLEEYEINYLIYLKTKEEARLKWQHKKRR